MNENNGWARVDSPGNAWRHEDGRVVAGRDGQTIEEILHEIETAAPPPPEAEVAAVAELTIRIFRSRFGDSDADLDLYDELDARIEAERSRLVKQQWRDPGAEIVEGGALHSAIATHLDALAPERKGELLARP